MPVERMNATGRMKAAHCGEGLQPSPGAPAFNPMLEDLATPAATRRKVQTSAAASRRLVMILTWIYCLSWAGDFRGTEQGGSAFQFLSFALTAGTGALLAVLGWRVLFRRPVGWLVLLWSGFLLSTIAVALAHRVVPGNYFRTLIPWLLVLTSMMVCQVAAGFGLSLRNVLLPMLVASALNVLWRAVYALAISGIDPEHVRVEMLSQCLPLLMALLMCGLFLQRTWPVWPVILGGLGITSYLFSVTRSAVLVIGAAALGAVIGLIVGRRAGRMGRGFMAGKLQHWAGSAALLVLVVSLLSATVPFVFERWYERVVAPAGGEYTSMDPSTLTRLAETSAFIRILDGDPLNYAFGMGIGQSYYWDEAYAVELAYTYGDVDVFRSEFREIWFPGHAIWTYAVFSSGVAGLCCHVLFFAMAAGMAWRAGKLAALTPGMPLHLAWLPFCGILAFVGASLTFNPFIERAAGLVLGFLAALPQFVMRDATKLAAARHRAALGFASQLFARGGGKA